MKKPKAPQLVTVAITTTITIVFWIFFTLYQVLTSKPPQLVDTELLEPLDPTLDVQLLDSIKGKLFFEEDQVPPPLTQGSTNELVQQIKEQEKESEQKESTQAGTTQ